MKTGEGPVPDAAGGRPFPLSRRQLLLGAGVLGGVALGLEGLLLEPNRLSPTRHRIGAPTSEGQAPLRLTVLTDLHLRAIGRLEEAVAAEVVDYDPDVVLVIGDSVDRSDALGLLRDLLGLLPVRIPKFATLGNWEYWSGVDLDALAAVYDRFGGRLLVNESVHLGHDGRSAVLVGVDDFVAGRPSLSGAGVLEAGEGEVLILSHCPAYRDVLGDPGRPVAAMLSGHTHGGQIALGSWAPVRPGGSGRYVSGWYRGGGIDLYVSRGIGTSVIPVRLGSTPEVAHFEWFVATTDAARARPAHRADPGRPAVSG